MEETNQKKSTHVENRSRSAAKTPLTRKNEIGTIPACRCTNKSKNTEQPNRKSNSHDRRLAHHVPRTGLNNRLDVATAESVGEAAGGTGGRGRAAGSRAAGERLDAGRAGGDGDRASGESGGSGSQAGERVWGSSVAVRGTAGGQGGARGGSAGLGLDSGGGLGALAVVGFLRSGAGSGSLEMISVCLVLILEVGYIPRSRSRWQ